ncbi:MAG: hypothetical protein AAF401_01265 [Pseudomonadota bacterium]
MRVSILIGLGLVVLGAGALYQVRNGFFMATIGAVTYSPPAGAEALDVAFRDLAASTPIQSDATLGQIADARATCVQSLGGKPAKAKVAEAFRRFNLMLLGAGSKSTSSVVDPQAHYVSEIRRSLVNIAAPWRDTELTEPERRRLSDVITVMTSVDHPVYADLDLAGGFLQSDLRDLANIIQFNGRALYDCEQRRLN